MTILKSTSAVACAFLFACGAAWAGNDTNQMPTNYYDELNAKLINLGYSGIRLIDAQSNSLVAYDREGSEVLLVAHPTNRTILRSTNVHLIDN